MIEDLPGKCKVLGLFPTGERMSCPRHTPRPSSKSLALVLFCDKRKSCADISGWVFSGDTGFHRSHEENLFLVEGHAVKRSILPYEISFLMSRLWEVD